MTTNIENLPAWVEESQRRGEQVITLLRNKQTGEEVELPVNPMFLAQLFYRTNP